VRRHVRAVFFSNSPSSSLGSEASLQHSDRMSKRPTVGLEERRCAHIFPRSRAKRGPILGTSALFRASRSLPRPSCRSTPINVRPAGTARTHAEAVRRPAHVCTACGQPTFSKQITAAGFQLKGSGWYATDFRTVPRGQKKRRLPARSRLRRRTEEGDESTAEKKSDSRKRKSRARRRNPILRYKPAAAHTFGRRRPRHARDPPAEKRRPRRCRGFSSDARPSHAQENT